MGRGMASRMRTAVAAAVLSAGAAVRGGVWGQVAPTGGITGIVFDSARAAPLSGAEVFLVGTTVSVATNDDGRFYIPDLRPGRYAVSFRHPRLDLRGFVADGVSVEVKAGEVVEVELAVPREMAARAVVAPVAVSRGGSGPAVIVGTVVDATGGRGIGGALVRVRGTNVGIVSDDRGKFVLFGLSPGSHVVDVEMLGYAPRSTPMAAIVGATLSVTIALSTRAIELEPVVVEVRSRLLDRVGFYDRVDDPGIRGHFLTPVEIEKRAPAAFTDLFTNVPGARVDYYAPGRSAVIFRRVIGSTAGEGCVPELWVDGMRIRGGDWNFLSPAAIDGVEVYVGTNIPIEYATSSCGVVLVWTKRGS